MNQQTADEKEELLKWADDHACVVENGHMINLTAIKARIEMVFNPLVNEDEVDKCPICEGRKIMNQMYAMLDKIPLIGSSIFDDGTANIINELDDAKSTWRCMCLDKESEA